MSMISRYIFGTPLPTMAVIREIAPSGGEIPHFTVTEADGSVSFTTILGDDDLIFGLGENVKRPFFLFISQIEPHHQNDRNRFEGPDGSKRRFAEYEVPGDLKGTQGDWRENYPDLMLLVTPISQLPATNLSIIY